MTNHGTCQYLHKERHDNITILFKDADCYHCVRIYVRTVNLLEKAETGCLSFKSSPNLEEACSPISDKKTLISMFNENYIPKNCRSAIEGVWSFGYQNRFSFTGECNNEYNQIKSCQTPGNQFLIANQRFTINYTKCEGIRESITGVTEYACLGDWFIGKNHYFALANTKESRKEEKYRCMVRNRDDDIYMGSSITPECQAVQTPENSPFRYKMAPVKQRIVEAGCLFPQNFTGDWINTEHTDADVFINETHIIETQYPDIGRFRRTIYVCREQKGNRYMLARHNPDGCQTDYVCFEFIPRHHNIIRFRKGVEMFIEQFSDVCSWVQFKSGRAWNYNLMLAKDPVPIQCPVAGKFNFTQQGDEPFKTRILGGLTEDPWDSIKCNTKISDLSVCDKDQKEIWIDAKLCLDVDAYGRTEDIYSDPDFKLKCVGYWKENMKSYLITYDELDPISRYRCWVYQRADINRIIMSQSVGPFCNLQQTVHAKTTYEGAAVSLYMIEYEREHDRCPMHFDDGSNPWKKPGSQLHVFNFNNKAETAGASIATMLTLLLTCMLARNH
ncbi:unnamed protein product [Meganyctiphanes norvegica]|uniref:Uncharacterized protein n=1 Tax=Meganyctiphanes norvegica TaxID=48144 RepID=A0AAV2QRR8_MEGNR